MKEQAAQILKVSAQLTAASPSDGGLELSKAIPQTALNIQRLSCRFAAGEQSSSQTNIAATKALRCVRG